MKRTIRSESKKEQTLKKARKTDELQAFLARFNKSIRPLGAKAKDITSIIVHNADKVIIPKEIYKLEKLKYFALVDCGIKDLPDELFELKLIGLALDSNYIRKIPEEIQNMTTLKQLRISRNELTDIPPEIAHLKNLEDLDLSYNKITRLPVELTELKSLKRIFLCGNNLPKKFLEPTCSWTNAEKLFELLYHPICSPKNTSKLPTEQLLAVSKILGIEVSKNTTKSVLCIQIAKQMNNWLLEIDQEQLQQECPGNNVENGEVIDPISLEPLPNKKIDFIKSGPRCYSNETMRGLEHRGEKCFAEDLNENTEECPDPFTRENLFTQESSELEGQTVSGVYQLKEKLKNLWL